MSVSGLLRIKGFECDTRLFGRIADDRKVTLIFSFYVKIFVHMQMSNHLDLLVCNVGVWFVNKKEIMFTNNIR